MGESKMFERFTVLSDSLPSFQQSNFRTCGPSLRLTGSHARLRGAVWYARQMNVGEGFDTAFSFRISNPSLRCINMHGVFDWCRSRGADGFAFVIHNSSPSAVGK
ncbi:MAG: lectin-like domain-containing protein, partial [bacterium]